MYFVFMMMFWSGSIGTFIFLGINEYLNPFPTITGIIFSLACLIGTSIDRKKFIK